MSLFKLNIDKLNLLSLPSFMRKPVMYAFCKVFSKPLKEVYDRFLTRRAEVLFLLKYDSGKYNIERYLNKLFGDGGTDIYITNNNGPSRSYLPQFLPFYLVSEDYYGVADRVYLNQYLPFYIAGLTRTAEFTVHIPESLHGQSDDIRAAVRRLALPSYTFEIVEY